MCSPLLAEYVIVHGLNQDATLMSYRGLMMAGKLLDLVSVPLSDKPYNFVQIMGALVITGKMLYDYTDEENLERVDLVLITLIKIGAFLIVTSIMNYRFDIYTDDYKLLSEKDLMNDKGEVVSNDEIQEKKDNEIKPSDLPKVGPPLLLVELNSIFDDAQKSIIKTFNKFIIKNPDLDEHIVTLKRNSIIDTTEFGEAINEYVRQCYAPLVRNFPVLISGKGKKIGGRLDIVGIGPMEFFRRKLDVTHNNKTKQDYYRFSQAPPQMLPYLYGVDKRSADSAYGGEIKSDLGRLLGSTIPSDEGSAGTSAVYDSCMSYMEALLHYAEDESADARREFMKSSTDLIHHNSQLDKHEEYEVLKSLPNLYKLIEGEQNVTKVRRDYLVSVINDTYAFTAADVGNAKDIRANGLKQFVGMTEKAARSFLLNDPQFLKLKAYASRVGIMQNTMVVIVMGGYVFLYLSMCIPGMFWQKLSMYFVLFMTVKMIPVTEAFIITMMRWRIADRLNEGYLNNSQVNEIEEWHHVYSVFGTSIYLSYEEVEAYLSMLTNAPLYTLLVITGGAGILGGITSRAASASGGLQGITDKIFKRKR